MKTTFLCRTMFFQLASLNSGSNGNCYYVGNEADAVLIDVGISSRETEKRMKQLGLSMQKLRAIFVSHEHGDHIKGVSVLANKYNLPVYITHGTASKGPILIRHLSKQFFTDEPVSIGSLEVLPFSKSHDAVDPHSFVITSGGVRIGVITDIGYACERVVHYFKTCHACILEANYDDEMLENGSYPVHLKNRIRSNEGHLSNKQALELFLNHRAPHLSHLVLGHLSKENNDPAKLKELFDAEAIGLEIHIASRYKAGPLITLNAEGVKTKPFGVAARQIKLFE